MRRITFLLVALLWCCISMLAQHRSESEAIQIAQEFFGKKGITPKLTVVSHQKVESQVRKKVASARKAPAKSQSFYVVNDEAGNRFVIVSADERMYQILGYSDNGVFDVENVPEGLLFLLDTYNRQYNKLGVWNEAVIDIVDTDNSYSEVKPMITTKWGQMEPFNAFCPVDKNYNNDTLSVTGCIATAMAQVINYWKYPERKCKGGTYQYYNPYYSGLQQVSFNFDDYEINWDNLVDNYFSATEEQKTEVAKLMYACGVSTVMGYSADGSGTMDYNIPFALKHFFGYNPNIVYRNRDYYTKEEWDSMIMEELHAGRPVLYGGYGEDQKGGHEWILDGCDDNGLYHCNFGHAYELYGVLVSGIGDGYYHLDAVKPTYLGVELGNYSYYQSMVCNISPYEIGEYEDTFYSDVFVLISETYFSPKVSFNLLAYCYSSDCNDDIWNDNTFSGEIGVGLFDTDYNFIASMYSESFTGKSYKKYQRIDAEKYITLDISAMEEDKDYIIAPYAKSKYAKSATFIRSHMMPTWYGEEYANNAYYYYKANRISDFLLLLPVEINKDDIDDDIIPGDANNDKIVDVADIVYIVNYIMDKGASDFNFKNADVDNDGVIDVADITLVVNIIMQANGSQAPAYINGVLEGLKLADLGNGKLALDVPVSSQYVASQFDVIVPSGSSISGISLNADIVNSHEVIYNKIGSNRYRVVVYSPSNNGFDNISGNLLTIETNGNSDKISVENMVCVTSSGMKYGYTNTESHTTGIKSITTANNNHAIYTIDGRKVKLQNLSKGMYIINGKKFVVK